MSFCGDQEAGGTSQILRWKVSIERYDAVLGTDQFRTEFFWRWP